MFPCHVFLSFSFPLLCLFPKGWQPCLSSSCHSPAATCPFYSGCPCCCLPLSFVYPKHPCRVFQLTYSRIVPAFTVLCCLFFLLGSCFGNQLSLDNICLLLPCRMPPLPPQGCFVCLYPGLHLYAFLIVTASISFFSYLLFHHLFHGSLKGCLMP